MSDTGGSKPKKEGHRWRDFRHGRRVRRAIMLTLVALIAVAVWFATIGSKDHPRLTPRTPVAAPNVVLSEDEKRAWTPLPADRTRIPVLLYHGVGPESDFRDAADAALGSDPYDFAKQMTLIKLAGFQTVSLQTFLRFVRGEPVNLPPRPFLLAFDDGRADSWINADEILRKLGFTAVMFVDVGRVAAGDREYLTWQELQTMESSGRWQVQLHAGRYGHTMIRWGPESGDTGPFYAYKKIGESLDDWKRRTFSDIEWGQQELMTHLSQYQPLAFAPPFGAYGQEGTNDPRIPQTLLTWLTQRFQLVFAPAGSWIAKPGSPQPLGRFEVKRTTSSGDLHNALAGVGAG